MIYLADHPAGPVQIEVFGYLQMLAGNKICLVTSEADVEHISELINACGYTTNSLIGRRMIVTIEEDVEEREEA